MICVLPIIKYWLNDTNMIVLPDAGEAKIDEKVQFEQIDAPPKE